MSQTGKRASTAAESEAAAKRRKDDEEPKKVSVIVYRTCIFPHLDVF